MVCLRNSHTLTCADLSVCLQGAEGSSGCNLQLSAGSEHRLSHGRAVQRHGTHGPGTGRGEAPASNLSALRHTQQQLQAPCITTVSCTAWMTAQKHLPLWRFCWARQPPATFKTLTWAAEAMRNASVPQSLSAVQDLRFACFNKQHALICIVLCCLRLPQVMEAGDYISSKVDADAEFIMGAVHDETLGDDVCVTIVATGVSPRTDMSAVAGAARARQAQQQAVAASTNGNGASRSSSPNPFMVPTAAAAPAAAAAAPKAAPVEEKPAGGPAAGKGGVQVPAFLRNMHRKK